MTEVALYRNLLQGANGPDVDGAKRCIYKQLEAHDKGDGGYWAYYSGMDVKKRQHFGATFKSHVIKAQRQLGLQPDGVFYQKTLHALYSKDRVDATSEALFKEAFPDPHEVQFEKMLGAMRWQIGRASCRERV